MSTGIAVCVKWVTPVPGDDDRFAGISPADAAALEWALRVAAASGEELLVVSVGPRAVESALRDALAVGATRAVRVDAPHGVDSLHTAVMLGAVVGRCRLVLCGDWSLDRGTGSVPAFLAAELGAGQALGLVDIDVRADGVLGLLRRLDGGRRERLEVAPTERCTVLSVEGGTARVRRASLRATLAARDATVTVVPGASATELVPPALRPYRPRARVLPAPAGDAALDRLRALTDAGSSGGAHGETVVLEPAEAADRILDALREWGELPA